ncbi:hypothetical protein [Arthrobacter wenxiniae]|uniref:Uncharacterized protein n=1 Tax=Arthrobacter wenxiniae TaxID=2713570 RepID=A0A7Y7M112_9MICC|nr:hypothetical protein [Arthrobacter wenxiniae]NVM96293.1 hypothetical protein [Arthrobacter wenxiniae]
MDFTHLNYYLLVYSGTVALGLLMLALMVLSFLAVMSVVAVAYGLAGAARRITRAAVTARPVVSPVPALLRHSSRPVVVLAPRTPPAPHEAGANGAGHQAALNKAAPSKAA